MQYIAPSGMFLLAVLVYGEPFTTAQLWTFILIWTALAIYSIDSMRCTGVQNRPIDFTRRFGIVRENRCPECRSSISLFPIALFHFTSVNVRVVELSVGEVLREP
jgi:hypothetical protein